VFPLPVRSDSSLPLESGKIPRSCTSLRFARVAQEGIQGCHALATGANLGNRAHVPRPSQCGSVFWKETDVDL